jgi:arabinose-5-phosphate isomerase
MPDAMPFDAARALELAARTLDIEAQALAGVKARLSSSFTQAVQAILASRGRVVVMGMGKSGHVGRKIAATLASTGTPAMFVHPAEASHGDLGMVTAADVVIAISNSGESDELNVLLPVLKRAHVPLIAMTGKPASTLAEHADIVLESTVEQEACPLNLAPTASTTAQMALGDALAVALLDARGFEQSDFARSHPGGALGRKLLVHVRDLMRKGDLVPRVSPDTAFTEMLREMGGKGMGATAIVDDAGSPDRGLHRWRPATPDREGHRLAQRPGRRGDAGPTTHDPRRSPGRRSRRRDGDRQDQLHAGRRRERGAGRRVQLERPDAGEGDMSLPRGGFAAPPQRGTAGGLAEPTPRRLPGRVVLQRRVVVALACRR